MSILSAFKSSVTTLVLLAAMAIPAHATVTTIGDVDPDGATDPWVIEGHLYVGKSVIGTLNIDPGGVVSNKYGYIGYAVGSTGEATVTGTNSRWNYDLLMVGYSVALRQPSTIKFRHVSIQ